MEGYTAPVQFGMYGLACGLRRLDFSVFFQLQFFIISFLLGLTLFAITRTESFYYILPLLVVFAIGYWLENRSMRGIFFIGLVLLQWTAYQVVRYTYFRSLFPNTANAQGISVFANLEKLAVFDLAYLGQRSGLAWQTFLSSGEALVLLALPLLFFAKIKRKDAFLILALLILTALTLLNPFLFGETRLDPLYDSTYILI